MSIEKRFLGGFERRFIRVKVERARLPFEEDEVNPEGWKHAFWLWDYIKQREGELWYIKTPSLEELRDRVMQLDEKYWPLAEEYSYKIAAALMLNQSKGAELSQGGIKVSKVSKNQITDINVMIPNDTFDTLYYMIPLDTLIPKNDSESFLGINDWPLHDTVDTMIRSLFHEVDVADDVIMKLASRIEELKKRPEDEGFMVKKMFVREILRTTNAQYYQHVLAALDDAGLIRAVNGKIFGRRGVLIVYDLQKRICPNCEHLKACAAKRRRLSVRGG